MISNQKVVEDSSFFLKSAGGSEARGDSHTAEPVKYGYAQIREAITERLGGPFDYLGFQ